MLEGVVTLELSTIEKKDVRGWYLLRGRGKGALRCCQAETNGQAAWRDDPESHLMLA